MAYIYKNKHGKRRIQYTDAAGKRRDVAGFSDLKETQREAVRLEEKTVREKRGIYDHAAESAAKAEGKPLSAHIEDWAKSVKDGGAEPGYAKQQGDRVKRILVDRLKYIRISQIDTTKVQAELASMIADADHPISQQTAAHFVQALRQFGRWIWKPGRRSREPMLDGLIKPTVTEPKRPRAAFALEEIVQLIEKTRQSKEYRFAMNGTDRAMLYLLAVVTGFRRGELRSLRPQSFDLQARVVTLAAMYTKNGKPARQELPMWLCDDLKVWLKGRIGKLFPIPDHSSRMLQLDIEAAGISTDPHRDFHCLRHTAITNWVRTATNFKVAQELARHSDPKTTMRYAHTSKAEHRGTIEATANLLRPIDSDSDLYGQGSEGGCLGKSPNKGGKNAS
jgi:integrase